MNTPKPFPNIIKKALLKVSISRTHQEYQKIKTLQLTRFIKLSLIFLSLWFLFSIANFLIRRKYIQVLWGPIVLIVCLLAWRFCERLKKYLSIIFFIFCSIFSVYSNYTLQKDAPVDLVKTFPHGFMVGYVHGLFEKTVCSRISNIYWRIFFSILPVLTRLIFFQDVDVRFKIHHVYLITISLIVEYMKEKEERALFQKFHDHRENLTKFKNLVSSGLSANLLILTNDLKEKLFSSDPFSEMTKTQGVYHWLDQLINENHTTTSRPNSSSISYTSITVTLLPKERDPPGDREIFLPSSKELKEMKNKENLRFNAKIQDNDTQRIFQIKVFGTIWDDKDAIVLVLNDITDHYLNMTLQMAYRNKDKMLAMISHELRTPLNGILGVVNILKKDIKEPQQLKYLTVCHNSGELLLNLVNSLLDLQQIRDHKFSLKFTKEDLYELLGSIYDLFKFQFDQKDLYLKLEISQSVPEQIVTDKNRLKQILINLIGNALKFSFKGGVTVLVDLDPVLQGYIHFRVSDTGIGIKEEDFTKLFKMYGRLDLQDTKTNTQGIGFGLEISNQLAILLAGEDRKNGGIKAESQLSQGTTFSFSIKDNSFNPMNSEESHAITYYEPRVYSENIEDIAIKMTPYLQKDIFSNDRTISPPPIISGLTSIAEDLFMPSVSLFNSQKVSILVSPPNLQSKSANHLKPFRSFNNIQRSRGNLSSISPKKKDYSFSDLSPVSPHQNKSFTSTQSKILIVDDNPFNLLVAGRIVERLGFEVETALNGELAIEKTRNCPACQFFSAVLMDLQMPVLDGYETTKILREMMVHKEIPEIPIIAVSANNTEDDKKRCKEVGMYTHLSKPLYEDLLEKVLSQTLRKEKSDNTFGEINEAP